jgi:hypothetical protein
MARLAGLEKALYYPTDLDTVELIAQHVTISGYSKSSTFVIDPCIGEGLAVHRFVQALKGKPWDDAVASMRSSSYSSYASQYANDVHASRDLITIKGIELDAERAKAAKELLGEKNILESPMENAAVVDKFDLMWCNPPYTYSNGRRVELNWVEQTANYLKDGGTAIFILPDMFVSYRKDDGGYGLNEGKYAREMGTSLAKAGYSSNLLVLRFPDSSYSQFKQVAVFATKNNRSSGYSGDNHRLIVAGNVGDLFTYDRYGQRRGNKHGFRLDGGVGRTEPTITRAVEGLPKESVFANGNIPASMIDFLGDPKGLSHIMRPLAPMRKEHAALVAAAGMFNGEVIDGKAIKGSTIKKVVRHVTEGSTQAGTSVSEIVDSEVLAAQLATIDMETGEMIVVNSLDDKEVFEKLLEEHAHEFVDLAERLYPPMFTEADMGQYTKALSHVHAPRKIKGIQNGLFPQQTFRAASILDGWKRHHVVTMVGEMGVGKSLRNESRVYTPDGFQTIGETQVGDTVIGQDGKPTTVLGVYPQGKLDIYRVTFTDGSSVDCSEDHLWEVQTPLNKWKGKESKILSLREIMEKPLAHANGNLQNFIPMTSPVQFRGGDLPVDPYLLGALIGDGCLSVKGSLRISSADDEILANIRAALPDNLGLFRDNQYDWRITSGNKSQQSNPIMNALRLMGLYGKRSEDKFIPKTYLYSSVEQRIALLQGLADTDGSVAGEGCASVEFTTVSRQLSIDVKELVQSLGGIVSTKEKKTQYEYNGEKRNGQLAYRMVLKLPSSIKPFRLTRKLELYRPQGKYEPTRAITSIKHVGQHDATCILVDNPRHLFLTDEFIVTHNTIVAAAACIIKAMQRKEHNRKIIVLLPPKQDLVNKWEEEMLLGLREFHPKVRKVETITDVQKAFAEKGLVIILIRETTAKMSSGWVPVYMPERRQPKHIDRVRPVLCPTCGHPLELSQEKPEKTKAHCVRCQAEGKDSAMWTVARRTTNKSDGPGYARYPLAKYIRDHYRDRYLLIIDEAHNMKAAESARGYAAQDLLASAHRTVQMTGTLYNGMASSIYFLLWRALPEFRKVWGWADSQKFVNEYGLFEKITKQYDNDRYTSSRSGYKQFSERISEKPGIHPAMIALLLPSTVFFGIRDLEVILPPYSEHTLFVDKPEKFQKIDTYLDSIRADAVQKMLQDRDMSLMSQLTWAKQGAWEMAAEGDYVDEHVLSPLDCPWDMWTKEEALLRLVAQEKRAGRPVLAFVGQINRRDNTGRLCNLLAQHGMKGAVMRADVKSRVEFVRTAIKGGADVIFTSAELVKEGIDLFELPTFVWLYGESKTYLVQQANRRAWRPGQDKECKIFYLAYNKTPQAERMDRLAKKLAAAQSIQGDVRQGLAAILGDEDFVSRLQDATVSTKHFESDLTIDDLPELEDFTTTTAPPLVDVVVEVTSKKPVRVHVTVEEIQGYGQLSLF